MHQGFQTAVAVAVASQATCAVGKALQRRADCHMQVQDLLRFAEAQSRSQAMQAKLAMTSLVGW